jgi:hypothetical protein
MEIHPPAKLESLKDVAFHLFIVTVGILIALSLEQIVEWRHHRELVREARTNIVSEIRDNKKELDALQTVIPELRKNQSTILQFIQDVMDHGKSKINSLQLSFHLAQLSDTSWTTAQTVGALGFMPYVEVKKYAAVYKLQDQYASFQTRTADAVVNAMTAFSENKDPNKLSHAELEAERVRVMESISALTAQSQIGEGLSKEYDKLLSK